MGLVDMDYENIDEDELIKLAIQMSIEDVKSNEVDEKKEERKIQEKEEEEKTEDLPKMKEDIISKL